MILRRLADAIRQQNWFTVCVELFIVIIGVFMGLQAQNWNQARIERNTAIGYHGQLVEELRRNAENLGARRDYYLQLREHGQAALDSLRADQATPGAKFLIDSYRATFRWPVQIDRAVYDEVLRAGVLSKISNIDARNRLTNFYVTFEAVLINIKDDPSYRNLVRSYMPVSAQRVIESDCQEIVSTASNGKISLFLPECKPQWSDALVKSAVESLLAAPGLTETLNRRMSNIDSKLIIVQRNMDRSRDLAEYFESTGP